MEKIQGTLIGILLFIFGIVATYYTWDMIVGFYGLIDSTLLRVFWIAGLFAVWVTNVIVVPFLFITGNSGVKVGNSIKGLLIFIVASFCSYLSYYIIPPIIETLNGITDFGDLTIVGEMVWFGLIIFWAIALIIYPVAVILKGGVLKQDNDQN